MQKLAFVLSHNRVDISTGQAQLCIMSNNECHMVVIAPLKRTRDRWANFDTFHLAHTFQLVSEDILFEQKLRFIINMLPVTAHATTRTERLAYRVYSIC